MRHGNFKIGNRTYCFRLKPHFPRQLTQEFLLVDLENNLDQLAENGAEVLAKVEGKAKEMDGPKLRAAVFGPYRGAVLDDVPADVEQ